MSATGAADGGVGQAGGRGPGFSLVKGKGNCENVRIVFKALFNHLILKRKINLIKCVCNFDFLCQNRLLLQNDVKDVVCLFWLRSEFAKHKTRVIVHNHDFCLFLFQKSKQVLQGPFLSNNCSLQASTTFHMD